MAQGRKRYRGFISYSQKDANLTKRLHRALEKYSLPKGLVTTTDRDRRLGRFFRDNDELAGAASLGAALEGAIEESENFILVASPDAARSNWVNEEIKYFKKHSGGRIFAVIARGIPNTGDMETECFPQALRFEVDKEGNPSDNLSEEPLAPDLTKENFSKVLVRLIAGIIEKPFDDLWQRDRRRRRRRRLVGTGIAVLLFGVLLWYWDAHFASHVEYYSSLTKRWDIFQGIGPLCRKDIRRRNVSLKFYYEGHPGRGGTFQKLEAVNGNGQLNPNQSYIASYLHGWNETLGNRRDCQWIIEYDDDGHKIREIARNRFGEVIYAANVTRSDSSTHTWYADYQIGAVGLPVPSGATQNIFTFDDRGFVTKVTYFDADVKPKAHPHGYFSESADYNEQGLRTKRAFFNNKGGATRTKWGYASEKVEYDDNGNIVRVLYYDKQDSLTYHRDGYAIVENKYDVFGNLKEIRYLDINGNPTVWKKGYAIERYEYNDKGNLVAQEFIDQDGNLTLNKQGYARFEAEYDNNGNAIKVTYFGKDSLMTFNKDGHQIVRNDFDENTNIQKRAYFDSAGNLTLTKDAYAIQIIKYNSSGLAIELTHFGKWDEPVKRSEGYHKEERDYDDRNRIALITYYDERNNFARTVQDSICRKIFEYHPSNRVSSITFYDEHNAPTNNKQGYSKIKLKYDIFGNIEEETYWNVAGTETQHRDGYHKLFIDYDSLGNWQTSWKFFDTAGRPVLNNLGYWKAEIKNDKIGNPKSSRFFDTHNRRILITDGYSAVDKNFDDRGNIIDEKYLDTDDKLIENRWAFAIARNRYNNLDLQVAGVYLDINDRLVNHRDYGFALFKKAYDSRGNPIREAWFDEDSTLTFRDKFNFVKVDAQFDSLDKLIRFTCWGTPEKSIPKGYAMLECYKLTRTYDRSVRLVGDNIDRWTNEILYDKHDDMILRTQTDYNEGKIRAVTFYNHNDILIAPTEYGFAKWVRSFDAQGRWTVFTYTSSETTPLGAPITSLKNCYKVVQTFDPPAKPSDEFTKWATEVQFGADNEVLLQTNQTHDDRGNLVEQAFYDPNDNPVIPFGKDYAKWVVDYDDQDLINEITFIGTEEVPLDTPFVSVSCIKMTRAFDAPVKNTPENLLFWTRATYYDDRDGILLKEQRKLNDSGNITERAFYDKNDSLMIHPRLGYAKIVANYNSQGLVKEITYLGTVETPLDILFPSVTCIKMTFIFDEPVKSTPDNLRLWTRAIYYDTNDSILFEERRTLDTRTGRYETACEEFAAADSLSPRNPQLLSNCGIRLYLLQDFIGAISKFEAADANGGLSWEAYYSWGTSLAKVSRHSDAVSKFDIAVQKADEAVVDKDRLARLYSNYGVTLDYLDQYQHAALMFEKAVSFSPTDPDLWAKWGYNQYQLGRVREAEEKFQEALRLAPERPETWDEWANALQKIGSMEADEKRRKASSLRSKISRKK